MSYTMINDYHMIAIGGSYILVWRVFPLSFPTFGGGGSVPESFSLMVVL